MDHWGIVGTCWVHVSLHGRLVLPCYSLITIAAASYIAVRFKIDGEFSGLSQCIASCTVDLSSSIVHERTPVDLCPTIERFVRPDRPE